MSDPYRFIPFPGKEYDFQNESVFRRQVEQNLRDVNHQIELCRNHETRTMSLATRRFQFLLMGASNG